MHEAENAKFERLCFRNPLVLRAFRGHLEKRQSQQVWDYALCFGWRYMPTHRVSWLYDCVQSMAGSGDFKRKPGRFSIFRGVRIEQFIGTCLPKIYERLLVLGVGVGDMRLMRFAESVIASGVDTDEEKMLSMARDRYQMRKEIGVNLDQARLVKERRNATRSPINVRGARNKAAAFGRLR